MAIELIRCPKCGMEAQSISVGTRGKIDVDAIQWATLCQAKGKSGTLNPFECPHLKAETERPRRQVA